MNSGSVVKQKEYDEIHRQKEQLSEKVKELERKNYDYLVEREQELEMVRREKERELQERDKTLNKCILLV